jgi:hypothetical protein
MDRKVEAIIAEWRGLEREHDKATDDETREFLEARIATVADEHRQAVDKRMPDEEPPSLDGALGASTWGRSVP